MSKEDFKPYWTEEREGRDKPQEEKKRLDDVFLSWVWSLVKRFFKTWGKNQKWVNLGIGYFIFFFVVSCIPRIVKVIEGNFYGYLFSIGVLTFLHTIWLKEVLIKVHVDEQVRELQKKIIELEQKLQSHDMYLAMKQEQK